MLDDVPIELPNTATANTASTSPQPLHRISPTDISQFIRLEQCQHYLRLRLLQREQGLQFMTDYGVSPQAIPPLLTKSGQTFEERNHTADPRAHAIHRSVDWPKERPGA